MFAAAGWGPLVSSPLATRLLSSLCLSSSACLASALSAPNITLAVHSSDGPWSGVMGVGELIQWRPHRVHTHRVVRAHLTVVIIGGPPTSWWRIQHSIIPWCGVVHHIWSHQRTMMLFNVIFYLLHLHPHPRSRPPACPECHRPHLWC